MKRFMADVPDHDAATLVALETAVEALPPLTRAVFLLHRVGDLSYDAIACRLSIGIRAVESGLADARYRLCCTLNGDTVERAMPQPLAEANASLSRRYRRAAINTEWPWCAKFVNKGPNCVRRPGTSRAFERCRDMGGRFR